MGAIRAPNERELFQARILNLLFIKTLFSLVEAGSSPEVAESSQCIDAAFVDLPGASDGDLAMKLDAIFRKVKGEESRYDFGSSIWRDSFVTDIGLGRTILCDRRRPLLQSPTKKERVASPRIWQENLLCRPSSTSSDFALRALYLIESPSQGCLNRICLWSQSPRLVAMHAMRLPNAILRLHLDEVAEAVFSFSQNLCRPPTVHCPISKFYTRNPSTINLTSAPFQIHSVLLTHTAQQLHVCIAHILLSTMMFEFRLDCLARL